MQYNVVTMFLSGGQDVKEIKIFAAFSAAAVLAASMLGGCKDNNTTTVKPEKAVVTTTIEIAGWATQEPSKTEATTNKTTTSRTTSAKAKNKTTTASKSDKSSGKTTKITTSAPVTETTTVFDSEDGTYVEYHFRSKKLLNEHFEKHGQEFADDFDYRTAKEYEKGASDVINNSEALHKTEAEDGDGVYYIEATNEFVILSTDGYIRTYFRPNGGKSYYDRQ
jgi:pyocin large subunit-like protein